MSAGLQPDARHSHAAAVIGHTMYIHGGTSGYNQTFADLHALELKTGQWQCLTEAAQSDAKLPGIMHSTNAPACFSHTLSASEDLLVVAGGCHTHGAGKLCKTAPHCTSVLLVMLHVLSCPPCCVETNM